MSDSKRDLVIIGAGPAGLSAAVYAKRAGLDALLIDEMPVDGGQVLSTYEVDNYLGLPGVSGVKTITGFTGNNFEASNVKFANNTETEANTLYIQAGAEDARC